MNITIRIKRAYEPPDRDDGYRMLIDRLWPRGVKKEDLGIDEWTKNLAPSTDLRQWFAHQPERFDEFAKKYRKELAGRQDELLRILKIAANRPVTLLYGAKNEKFNQAQVLRNILIELSKSKD